MNELIPLQQHEGRAVVSARDLHAFLEDRQKFADWIKKRIVKYGLVEGQDYTTVHNIMNGGKFSPTEYVLTIEAAKELAMVQANEKGKQARQYFIECENRLRIITEKPVIIATPAEQLLQQAKLMVQQEQRLTEIESKQAKLQATVSEMLAIQQQAAERLLELPTSSMLPPEQTTRSKVQQLVNAHSINTSIPHQEIWRVLYDRLYYLYGVKIRGYKKAHERESWLDVAVRAGHIDKLFSIASAEFHYQNV